MNSDLEFNKLITIVLSIIIILIVIITFIITCIIPVIKLTWGCIKNIFHNENKDPIKSIPNNNIVNLKLEKTEKKKIDYINENYYQGSQHTFKGGSNYIVEYKNRQRYIKFSTRLSNWDKAIFRIKFKPNLKK